MTSNIFVQTVKTSMGIYHRFILRDNNTFKSIAYMPYKKLSENEYEVTPDINRIISDIHFDIRIKSLEPYDENKKYINVFQNTSKENNVMNYDEYGFPIFDDEWEDDKAFQETLPIKEFMKEHPGAKTISEHWEKEEINIKKEDKEEVPKDKFSLF